MQVAAFQRNKSLLGALLRLPAGIVIALLGLVVLCHAAVAQSSVRPPGQQEVQPGTPAAKPGTVTPVAPATKPAESERRSGDRFDPQLWEKVRKGVQGKVTIPDEKAGTLVQSAGEDWRLLRTRAVSVGPFSFKGGPVAVYGGLALVGTLVLLMLFFLIRGRIRIEHGLSGRRMVRFNDLERMGHWLLAVSFIVLAITGLMTLYGRQIMLPVLGKETFAFAAYYGKLLHGYVAFAFMAGLVLTFVMWVWHNFPNVYDLIWLAKAGGLFSRGSHPPAKKFNAGQKMLFWLVMFGGLSMSLSGLALMFPFQMPMFAKTFAYLNMLGLQLPTVFTPIQEMQYAATWHGIMAMFLICVIFGHIYIGTVGMQGAFDAMGSGNVDENWAKEHHSIWAEKVLAEGGQHRGPAPAPAE
ncbi:MAG: formate dehydrogenase subunit gamma [Hyphomicrobiaceae bacterium]